MEIIKEIKGCCGCTACFSICPKGAIKMKPDNEGFLYPVINKQLCIDCGLCKNVCNLQLNKPNRSIYPYVYGVKNKNESIRLNSTSGGAFSVIAEYIIRNGGYVYGAAFDDAFDVVHVRAEQLQQLNNIRGTKYVQSDIRGIYHSVFEDLTNQRRVLFTGTPCQCGGLRKFLSLKKCDMSSLLLCDIICHGFDAAINSAVHIIFFQQIGDLKLETQSFFEETLIEPHRHIQRVNTHVHVL